MRERIRKIFIEDGKIKVAAYNCFQEWVYEEVKKIPKYFFVWNIGENFWSDHHVPLAEWENPGDEEDFYINPMTLKYIEMEPGEVEIMREAAGYGVASLAEAQSVIDGGPEPDGCRYEWAVKALPVFVRYTE